jgi:hypothetical protein
MRIIADERHIHVRRLIGKFMPLAGLVALMAGLVVSYTVPEQFTVTMGAMVLGIILSLVGGFFNDRYAGPLAHHEALATALKGLDNHYALLDYVLPVSHALLEPGGLTVLLVKTHGGQVAYTKEKGQWKHRQRGKVFRQLAGQESIGSPDVEAEHQAKRLAAWLADRLPNAEVPVRAAIVFVNPNVELDASESPVPAFYSKKIKAWLRGPGKLKPLPAATHRQLAEVLGADAESDAET